MARAAGVLSFLATRLDCVIAATRYTAKVVGGIGEGLMASVFARGMRSWVLRAAAALAAGAMAFGTAAAATYVDTGLPDLKPEERVVVVHPKPVQLLFQFKTKGAANGRATKWLKDQVVQVVQASGLFSEVTEGPASDGALVNVTIDNVPLTSDAFAKGFATGLTFGLAGTSVSDGYICTVEYLSGSDAQKITKTAHHAIHTTVGLKSAPPNGEKAPSVKAAVETMTRQIVSHALNDLAADPVFNPGVVAPPPVAEAPASPTAEPAPAVQP